MYLYSREVLPFELDIGSLGFLVAAILKVQQLMSRGPVDDLFKLRRRVQSLASSRIRVSPMSSSLIFHRLAYTARSQVRQLARPQILSPSLLGRLYATSTAGQPNTANSPPETKPPTETPPPGLIENNGSTGPTDWSKSYHGLSSEPFPKNIAEILQGPVDPLDVEIKPGTLNRFLILCTTEEHVDGLIYLPEIKYRRILNKAFGPGGWGLAPRSETNVGPKVVSREYALVCLGRFVLPFGKMRFFMVEQVGCYRPWRARIL